MAFRVAAVTMVYNEADLLPIWLRHYSLQVGAAQCHIIDHGSDDGCTDHLGAVNVLRLPRSAMNDTVRARFVSLFCAALLEYYDAVLHTDVDEIVVADPARFASLADYAASMPADTVNAIGLELIQVAETEAAIEPGRPILAQRGWVRFSSALCKPVLTRKPRAWAPGFHCADAPMVFDALTLFHLRYHDQLQGLLRLAKTRAMPWADPYAGEHQRVPDAEWQRRLVGLSGVPRRSDVTFHPASPPVADWLDRVLASQAGREGQAFTLDLGIMANELWAVPHGFGAVF